MTESEKETTATVRVNDRRRFDMDGNIREEPASATQAAEGEGAGEPEITVEVPAAVQEDPRMAQLERDLEASRKRVNDLALAVQQMSREKEEFKQRLTRERDRMLDLERAKVAEGLFEALDQLDLCLQASFQDESPLAKGVRLIRDKLLSQVQGMGLERMSLLGQVYDPNLAEAVDMEITAVPEEDQKVVAEIRAGYRMQDKVVRAARVKVAKYVQPANA
jgi:molecular chaperone GrpE